MAKPSLVRMLLRRLNSTKLFFNLYIVFSSTLLLRNGTLAQPDFVGLILLTSGIYFLGATGAYVIHAGDTAPDERPAKRKFTEGEFLYFCLLFGIAFFALNTRLLSSENYFTLVVWTYCIYNGVNVGQDFLRARGSSISDILVPKKEKSDGDKADKDN